MKFLCKVFVVVIMGSIFVAVSVMASALLIKHLIKFINELLVL
jgi:hypothetical protein